MNDPKLKLAMARLLPERIILTSNHIGEYPNISWMGGYTIIDTEWLHVMHLVELELFAKHDRNQCYEYQKLLNGNFMATFNLRATAMCKVKGITP